jgi:hypothetical protein
MRDIGTDVEEFDTVVTAAPLSASVIFFVNSLFKSLISDAFVVAKVLASLSFSGISGIGVDAWTEVEDCDGPVAPCLSVVLLFDNFLFWAGVSPFVSDADWGFLLLLDPLTSSGLYRAIGSDLRAVEILGL